MHVLAILLLLSTFSYAATPHPIPSWKQAARDDMKADLASMRKEHAAWAAKWRLAHPKPSSSPQPSHS